MVGAIGFAAAVVTFAPRLQIDVLELAEPLSPFPSSVTITNGFLPLDQVSVYVRIGSVVSPDQKARIIGWSTPSKSAGGIIMPGWQNHHLATDEKWTIPMGSSVPFTFNTGPADVLIVATYWPWLVPKPFFIALRERAARFVTHHKQDGTVIWVERPVD